MSEPGAPFWADDMVTLYHGDCMAVLAGLPDASVDAVITDPPYGLEFMGASWDTFKPAGARIRQPSARDKQPGAAHNATTSLAARNVPEQYAAGRPYQRWCEAWATECLRVLKPGGHLLAFGGTRTWHRLVCGIEDAGFEIRDSIAWLYGSGFPKSHNISKAIDRARGDTGAVRVVAEAWEGWGTALKPAHEPVAVARKPLAGTVAGNVLVHGTGGLNIAATTVGGLVTDAVYDAGRWPPNVLLDGHTAARLDGQAGLRSSGANPAGRSSAKFGGDLYGEFTGGTETPRRGADTGGASRFFPVFRYEPKAPASERPRGDDGKGHPTVKPLDLMRWLARLVTPPGGTVLDMFAGSGTTGEACVIEGFACILAEQDAGHCARIVRRLSKPIQPVLG